MTIPAESQATPTVKANADQASSGKHGASLGLVTLLGLVIANMIGVGIFTSSGFSLATLGNPGRVMLAWILCGIWAISGAFSYGSLVSRLPMSGGEYLFLSRFVHPSIGFLAGWISLFAGFTAPIALAAKGAALHSLSGATSEDTAVAWLAVFLIIAAAGMHLVGVHVGTRTQNGIVFVKLLMLVWILIAGYFLTPWGNWQGGALPGQPTAWLPQDFEQWWVLAGSMSWIALSYTGFNAAVYVAGESANATRSVPRAMAVGTGIVMLLYLALNYLFVYVPSPESLVDSSGRGREEVAVIATQAIGGPGLSGLLRVTVVLSLASSVFAMLMLGPRVYRQMSHDGVMPKFVGGDSFRPAMILQCCLSIIAVFLGNILQLMTYLGLTLTACGAMTVASLWWVHHRIPGSKPLGIFEQLSAATYLCFSLCLIVAASQQRSEQFLAMLWTFAVGLVVYFGWIAVSRRATRATAE